MKNVLFVLLLAAGFSFGAQAQKYAIIDTKFILGKMPEYVDADKKLQQISDQWQKDIDNLQSQLTTMYKNYDAEQVMLSGRHANTPSWVSDTDALLQVPGPKVMVPRSRS